jgi:RimJ/RimL family protein N-acetyltransferase
MPWKTALEKDYGEKDTSKKKRHRSCQVPEGFKLIRFTKSKDEKYQRTLSKIRMYGPVAVGSRPYIGLMSKSNGEIASCIWKDKFGEISMITHAGYRKMGLMNYLVCEMIHEVFRGRLKIIMATPMNLISMHILEKYGFEGEDQDYEFSI